ncbi:peptide/h+ symporter protein [Ephemerocybe angulata]|uniref:Peptide/h+ symporter protein n=1 Tax=Ephemerocybe angulata TaxID=980116 RepID=A0A8H6M0K0_9AGAR|nr:peptide/h+ symporter protein [Tulosesus angulatus]
MAEKFDEKKVARAPSLDDEKHAISSDTGIDGDSVIEGTDGVTHNELKTLRLVRDKLPLSSFLVVFVEFAERWSYYGTANLYNNYIRAPLPRFSTTGAVAKADRDFGVAGALGKGQPTSFSLRTFNSFFVYVTPLLGGVIADTMWGRYKTILVFSLVCLAGHVILVGSASPSALQNGNVSLGLLALSILVIGVGAGCIKANVSPMVAEQYTGVMHKKTLDSGEVVIVSPEVTIQSTYLWFYAAINFGSTGAISAAFLARDQGYWIAYLIPTLIFVLVPFVLVLGKRFYVVTPPRGSILLETFRVIGFALRPALSFNIIQSVKLMHKPEFWDPAKPSYYEDGKVPARITWDDEFVGEVHRTVSACGVFLFFPFFWLCYSQIDGNLGTTAAGMTLHGTPNDLIQNLNPISIIVMIPIFDTSYIDKTSPCHGTEFAPSECELDHGTDFARPNPSPLNVWIVSGPYILVGMAEIFASITSLEYAFTKAPSRMKSVVMSFSQLQTAVASAINFALTAVNTEPKFTWLYGSFAVVSWIVGVIFFFTFRELDRKEIELNALGKNQDRHGFAGEAPEDTTVKRRAVDPIHAPVHVSNVNETEKL